MQLRCMYGQLLITSCTFIFFFFLVKVPEVHRELFTWKVNPGVSYTEESCRTGAQGAQLCINWTPAIWCGHNWHAWAKVMCTSWWEWDKAEEQPPRTAKVGFGPCQEEAVWTQEGSTMAWRPLAPSWCQREGAGTPHCIFFPPPFQPYLLPTHPESSFMALGQHPTQFSQAPMVANPAALSAIEATCSRQKSHLTWA